MSLGPSEILVVLVVALIVLGPDRLPKAARQIGKFMAEFRKFSNGIQDQVTQAMQMPDAADPPETPKSANPPNPDTSGYRPIDAEAAAMAETIKPPPAEPDEDEETGAPKPSATPWRPQASPTNQDEPKEY